MNESVLLVLFSGGQVRYGMGKESIRWLAGQESFGRIRLPKKEPQ